MHFRLTAVVLVAGLVGAPIVGVYCNDLSAQAAECCTRDPGSCGEPARGLGADCCQRVPAGKDSAERTQTDAAKRAAAPVLATTPAPLPPAPVAGIPQAPALPALETASSPPTILRL